MASGGSDSLKVKAGRYTTDDAFTEENHDLGPWVQTARSSRVSQFRYDYANQVLQVQWRNGKNHGYAYLDVPYEMMRQFGRVVSKGRYVNSQLNGFPYRPMTDEEVAAPSNERRSGPSSRFR